jgi:hypothetical protein
MPSGIALLALVFVGAMTYSAIVAIVLPREMAGLVQRLRGLASRRSGSAASRS